MSGALAIAAVTATLKDLLNDGLLNHDLSSIGSFSVTATAPDRITTGETESNQLNLFLYQVTPNLGWRNFDLPARDARGTRLSNPPLALDLHYLLTSYGSQDLNAEVLLGYAMQLLHETPVISRDQLRTVLGPPPPVDGTLVPGLFGSLSAVDLADQVELIKITPAYLSTEDLSKLWTAMQARYRPTMAYMVSVVLIQATGPVRAAQPVLKRGQDDRGALAAASGLPTLSQVRPLASDLLPAMRLGDDLLITGSQLDVAGTLTAVFSDAAASITQELDTQASVVPVGLKVHVPAPSEDPQVINRWTIGVYSVCLRVTPPTTPAWTTNAIPIALAPTVTLNQQAGTVGGTITLSCAPRLTPRQVPSALVLFGSQSVVPDSVTTPADPTLPTAIQFTVPSVAPGTYLVRLRVNGVDSVPVVISGSPPSLNFDSTQQVTVS